MSKTDTTKKAMADLQAELQKEISKLKRNVCPGYDAQEIRARLSTSFDSAASKQGWLSDHAPEYVWDLIDIAAQWGLNQGSLYGARSRVR
jgi:hypothetical protein